MTLSSPFAWDTGRDGGENAIGVSKSRSPRRTNATVHATVEGSSPRWHLPGRAHVPQPYEVSPPSPLAPTDQMHIRLTRLSHTYLYTTRSCFLCVYYLLTIHFIIIIIKPYKQRA